MYYLHLNGRNMSILNKLVARFFSSPTGKVERWCLLACGNFYCNTPCKKSSFFIGQSASHDMFLFYQKPGGHVIVSCHAPPPKKRGMRYPDVFLPTPKCALNIMCTMMINSLSGRYKTNIDCFYLCVPRENKTLRGSPWESQF